MTSRSVQLSNSTNFNNDFRNKIINGDFLIWQRGTGNLATTGYHSDRWANGNAGTTRTSSFQIHPTGQTDVPGSPLYFSRHAVTSVAGAGNYSILQQNIEFVTTLANSKATLTFYAKADANRNMAFDLYQYFGTGGSATVQGIGATKVALTTSWKKFSYVVDIPSISGKVFGSNYTTLALRMWFDAGTTFDAYTGALGQQSGTFDISHVSLVEGDATAEIDPFTARHYEQELQLCQRYYNMIPSILNYSSYSNAGNSQVISNVFFRQMRVTPAVTFTGVSYSNGSTLIVNSASTQHICLEHRTAAAGASYAAANIVLEAEI